MQSDDWAALRVSHRHLLLAGTYHNRRAADWGTLWVSLSLAVISKRLIPGFY